MLDLTSIPGITILNERDLPAAFRDVIASCGQAVQAFAAHDLPASLDDVLGPGVTIVVTGGHRAPTKRPVQVRDLIDTVERIAADLQALQQASDEPTAIGAAAALRAALIQLASTPAGRNSDVRAKARCIRAHLATSDLSRTGRAMVEAALAADAEAWRIGKSGH